MAHQLPWAGLEPFLGGEVQQQPSVVADGVVVASAGVNIHFNPAVQLKTQLTRAMFFLWERMKMVVEPTGALAFAALFTGKAPVKNLRVGVVLSGGNVDLRWAAAQISKA